MDRLEELTAKIESYREFQRRKAESQRLLRAKKRREAELNNPNKTRKYSRKQNPLPPVRKSPGRDRNRHTQSPRQQESKLELVVLPTEPTPMTINYDLSPERPSNKDGFLVQKADVHPPQIIIIQDDDEAPLPRNHTRERVFGRMLNAHDIIKEALEKNPYRSIGDPSKDFFDQQPGEPEYQQEEEEEDIRPVLIEEEQPPEQGEEEDDFEFVVDEEQEAFFNKRDRILRLLDQLDPDDRLDQMTQIENDLRRAVRRRILKLQAVEE